MQGRTRSPAARLCSSTLGPQASMSCGNQPCISATNPYSTQISPRQQQITAYSCGTASCLALVPGPIESTCNKRLTAESLLQSSHMLQLPWLRLGLATRSIARIAHLHERPINFFLCQSRLNFVTGIAQNTRILLIPVCQSRLRFVTGGAHLAAGGCQVDEREGCAGQHHVAQPGVRRPQPGVEPAQRAWPVRAQATPQNPQRRPQLPYIQHQVHQRLRPRQQLPHMTASRSSDHDSVSRSVTTSLSANFEADPVPDPDLTQRAYPCHAV